MSIESSYFSYYEREEGEDIRNAYEKFGWKIIEDRDNYEGTGQRDTDKNKKIIVLEQSVLKLRLEIDEYFREIIGSRELPKSIEKIFFPWTLALLLVLSLIITEGELFWFSSHKVYLANGMAVLLFWFQWLMGGGLAVYILSSFERKKGEVFVKKARVLWNKKTDNKLITLSQKIESDLNKLQEITGLERKLINIYIDNRMVGSNGRNYWES